MAYAFISYVREDQAIIDRLNTILSELQIHTWLDRESIRPGELWNVALRTAIEKGSFFVACFSSTSTSKPSTYMTEELSLAASCFTQRDGDGGWLIPIKLSPCDIPPISIGDNKTLRDLQWIDFYSDWDEGVHRLVEVIRPLWFVDYEREVRLKILRDGCFLHINNKMKHFDEYQAHRFKEIEDRWKDLIVGKNSNALYKTMLSTMDNSVLSNRPKTERIIEPDTGGRMVIITSQPSFDNGSMLKHLSSISATSGPDYVEFVIEQRRRMRELPHWEDRDLVHWIFRQEGPKSEMECDLLYLCSYSVMLDVSAYRHYLLESGKAAALMPVEQIYPTSLISATECEVLVRHVLMEDARATK